MTTERNAQGVAYLDRYTKAMVAGNIGACIRIEQRFDLYGYPPNIVSIGLKAVDEGNDPAVAVDAYLLHGDSNAD